MIYEILGRILCDWELCDDIDYIKVHVDNNYNNNNTDNNFKKPDFWMILVFMLAVLGHDFWHEDSRVRFFS